MKYSKKQKFSYKNSNRRINLWEGSVRSGKSWIINARWLKYIGDQAPNDGELIMVGKTNESLYRNVIKPILEMVGDDGVYIRGTRILRLWGKEIYCFGANDERAMEKIQGMTCCGAMGDEVALWPESFFKMLLTRLSVKDSKFFGSTNPDNPHHWLKTDFIDNKNDIDMTVFHFTLEDNEWLMETNPKYAENLKKEFTGVWYKRYILGLWVLAEGAIYDFFDENIHVVDEDSLPLAKYYVAAIDYGTKNPFAFGLFGVDPTSKTCKVWLKATYFYDSKVKKKQQTDEQYLDNVEKWLEQKCGSIKPRQIYIDPSAASFKVLLKQRHYYCIDADNDVENGIETQARFLSNGTYRICKNPDNKEVINEYYAYVWDPKKADVGEDTPIKQNDHGKDMERYMLHTFLGTKRLDYSLWNA